jgi:hypothetical protein
MNGHLRKVVTWIITSVVGLVVAVGAVIYQTSSRAGTAPDGNGPWQRWTSHLPNLPHHGSPPAVPEVNTGLVLLPILLAILVFSSRHLLRRRGFENQ